MNETPAPVDRRAVEPGTPLAGITLDRGVLVVDPAGPMYPGDLLHEAGHLALLPPRDRVRATGRLDDRWGTATESGAICWSVAAAWHLHLDLRVVLHDHGYHGAGARIATTFELGGFPGLPLPVDAGLTKPPAEAAAGEPAFPAMARWLCE